MTTVSYYQHRDHSAPAAVVRYTIIGDDNRPLDIQQLKYENNPIEISELQQLRPLWPFGWPPDYQNFI